MASPATPRTLVISDLHLGSRTGADVLRRPEARKALAAALDGIERLVLLGDVLELRHGPVAEAIEAGRPALGAIAGALRPGTEVVVLAGNHDHALVAPWLEDRAVRRDGPLGEEARTTPGASPAARALADALAPAEVVLAYPGVRLRDDVYATHGHYLDVHLTIPTFERLGAGAMRRVIGGPWPPDGVEGYEALLAPLYAWLHIVARHTRIGFGAERQRGTQTAWRALTGNGGTRSMRTRALVAGFPLAIAAVNRLGLGPVGRDLSAVELRRSALRAMHATASGLGVRDGWVLFGHTHRAGPWPGDEQHEWQRPGGPRLVNTGSWVHEEAFLGMSPRKSPYSLRSTASPSGRSPYWPGSAVIVEAEGPPRLVNLLPDFTP